MNINEVKRLSLINRNEGRDLSFKKISEAIDGGGSIAETHTTVPPSEREGYPV